jgi:hypothetical protein
VHTKCGPSTADDGAAGVLSLCAIPLSLSLFHISQVPVFPFILGFCFSYFMPFPRASQVYSHFAPYVKKNDVWFAEFSQYVLFLNFLMALYIRLSAATEGFPMNYFNLFVLFCNIMVSGHSAHLPEETALHTHLCMRIQQVTRCGIQVYTSACAG